MPELERGVRHAALTLHELPPADRAKVLSRLDPERQALLQPLLDELIALGIPQGRKWISRQATESKALDEADAAPSTLEQLHWLDADDAMLLLKHQSNESITIVLLAVEWPWRAEVLEKLPVEVRDQIKAQLIRCPTLPARLAHFVIDRLQSQLEQLPKRSSVAVTKSVHRPWYRRFLPATRRVSV
jgi:hypothetical protein